MHLDRFLACDRFLAYERSLPVEAEPDLDMRRFDRASTVEDRSHDRDFRWKAIGPSTRQTLLSVAFVRGDADDVGLCCR